MRFVPKWMMLALVALATTALHARENAVLRTGFTISHDHHQQIGTRTRLFLKADSEEYVDIESEKIVSFEPDESPFRRRFQSDNLPAPRLWTSIRS